VKITRKALLQVFEGPDQLKPAHETISAAALSKIRRKKSWMGNLFLWHQGQEAK
jgi:hypothetical protein